MNIADIKTHDNEKVLKWLNEFAPDFTTKFVESLEKGVGETLTDENLTGGSPDATNVLGAFYEYLQECKTMQETNGAQALVGAMALIASIYRDHTIARIKGTPKGGVANTKAELLAFLINKDQISEGLLESLKPYVDWPVNIYIQCQCDRIIK